MIIDLQTHTTASDGTWTPAELVQAAAANGVDVVGITDHDTVAGIPEALEASASVAVTVAPGLELSASVGTVKVHVLGLFIDHGDGALRDTLGEFRRDRAHRAAVMVERLNELGYPLSIDDVMAQAGNAALGRPHVARALVARGLLPSIQEAFSSKLLGDGGAADVARAPHDPSEAIALIRAAKGAAVLAHPGRARNGRPGIADELVERFARDGLAGLEVDHPDHDLLTQAHLRDLALRLDLVATGGSDCHGPGSSAGARLGRHPTSPESYERLRARSG